MLQERYEPYDEEIEDEEEAPPPPTESQLLLDVLMYDTEGKEVSTDEIAKALEDDVDGEVEKMDAFIQSDAKENGGLDNIGDDDEPESELTHEPVPLVAMPMRTLPIRDKSRIRVSKEVRDEALRRIELSARTLEDFQAVTAEYDRRDSSRERKERRHEQTSQEYALDQGVMGEGKIFPTWLNSPTFRQICRGYFLDFLANCPFEMENLSAKAYVRKAVLSLRPDQRLLLYQTGIRLMTPQELAAMRGQTDRNIRKIRDSLMSMECSSLSVVSYRCSPS